jgi:hypothetical protein
MDGVRSHPHLIDVNFLTLMVGFFQVFPMNVKVGGVALNLTILDGPMVEPNSGPTRIRPHSLSWAVQPYKVSTQR